MSPQCRWSAPAKGIGCTDQLDNRHQTCQWCWRNYQLMQTQVWRVWGPGHTLTSTCLVSTPQPRLHPTREWPCLRRHTFHSAILPPSIAGNCRWESCLRYWHSSDLGERTKHNTMSWIFSLIHLNCQRSLLPHVNDSSREGYLMSMKDVHHVRSWSLHTVTPFQQNIRRGLIVTKTCLHGQFWRTPFTHTFLGKCAHARSLHNKTIISIQSTE